MSEKGVCEKTGSRAVTRGHRLRLYAVPPHACRGGCSFCDSECCGPPRLPALTQPLWGHWAVFSGGAGALAV